MRKPVGSMKSWALLLLLGSLSSVVNAYNQPPVNLSATTFMDGGAPQGFYYLNYAVLTEGRQAMDKNGDVISGDGRVNALVNLHQFYYVSKIKILGASLALDVAMPVAAVTMRGQLGLLPLSANTAGLGDLIVGPALHWDGKTFLGKPVFHRIESDWTFPTGKYDKNKLANPGSNLLTVDSYYSFVWFFHPRWETSWRLWYAIHNENDEHFFGKVKPGQLFHANYAASYALTPKWRIGGAGYYLQQTTEDVINGVKSTGSKERGYAFGPGLVYMGQGLAIFLSHPIEFGVKNRFKGSRTTLQMIHKF